MKRVMKVLALISMLVCRMLMYSGMVSAESSEKAYPISVEGGYVTDFRGERINYAYPGDIVYLYPNLVKGQYVKSWKAEGMDSFEPDHPMEGNAFVWFTMPAQEMKITAVFAPQTQKTIIVGGSEKCVMSIDEQIWFMEASGWQNPEEYFSDSDWFNSGWVDLDGDGWNDVYFSPTGAGASMELSSCHYRSFAGDFTLAGANSSPYSPIVLQFADGNRSPFEVDLSEGVAPAFNRDYFEEDGEEAFVWLKKTFGMEGQSYMLDIDRNGTPDIMLGTGSDAKDSKYYETENSPYFFILDTYSLGDRYTVPKSDDKEYVPFTFVLKGKGIHPAVDMFYAIDLSDREIVITEQTADAFDIVLQDSTARFWMEKKDGKLVFIANKHQIPEAPVAIYLNNPITVDGRQYGRVKIILPAVSLITVENGYAYDEYNEIAAYAMEGDLIKVCPMLSNNPGGYFFDHWNIDRDVTIVSRGVDGEISFIMPPYPVRLVPAYETSKPLTIDLSSGYAEFDDAEYETVVNSIRSGCLYGAYISESLCDINNDGIADLLFQSWENRIYPVAGYSCGSRRAIQSSGMYKYSTITIIFDGVEGKSVWIAASPTPRPKTPTPTATPTEALGEPTVTPSETKDDKSVNPLFIIIPTSVFVFGAVTAILLLNRRRKVK